MGSAKNDIRQTLRRWALPALGILVLVGATLARIVLAYKTPVCPNTDAVFDDMLVIRHASSISKGAWLGVYDGNTLVKNPGSSLFVALFSKLGMRYQLGLALMLVACCAVAARSLRPLVRSRAIRGGLYLILLYLPAFFTYDFFQRVYRNGIANMVVLVVFSALIGLYLRRGERLRVVAAWSVLAGLSLGFFSIIQESAAWVLPFALVCTLVTLALVARDAWKCRGATGGRADATHFAATADAGRGDGLGSETAPQVAGRLLLVVLPLVLYYAIGACVVVANNAHYGVSLHNDKYEGEFARATASITSIDVGYPDNRVWISTDALEEALRHSSTLAQMEKEIKASWETWGSRFVQMGLLTSEQGVQVMGDHSYWALREAYYDHGGYRDAVETEKYWRAVADELSQAFDRGELKKKDGLVLSQTTQPMPWGTVPVWASTTWGLMCDFSRGELMRSAIIKPLPDTVVSGGILGDQMFARGVLGNNTIFMQGDKLYVDRTSEVAQPWLKASNMVGKALCLVHEALLPICCVLLLALTAWDIKTRDIAGISTALILLGLCLSGYALTFAASWMISFLSAGVNAQFAGGPAYGYCGGFFMALGLAECVVLGRFFQKLTDNLRLRRLSSSGEKRAS